MTTEKKSLDLSLHPHRRFNPLNGEWILVSPQRTARPWQGKMEADGRSKRIPYDPNCYLCPGNQRAGEARNPKYSSTFVFDNDFSALRPDTPLASAHSGHILRAEGEPGQCRVVCFSPRHDLTLAEMSVGDIRRVLDLLADEYRMLGSKPSINSVQIFENKGELMGCSNPHPHCQIWAERTVPVESAKEIRQLKRYRRAHKRCLLCDYAKLERRRAERIACENEAFVVVVPFWAVWPFETILISRRHFGSFSSMRESEKEFLADILRRITVRYDNLFRVSFPYSAGFHQSPTDGKDHGECHFHMHFFPPLLRSATIRKFMVGYEMLAQPQRDITPESSAGRLRELPEVHFSLEGVPR
ncbi:MAG TPA: UDP-glucose--hexose-1-phosphate uridylyltransferase [Bacteroidota bacterium]|nr:UDP-glucose--hexose-1-phosphate uridylyltransferase [Bacteroidota bacterium]